MQQGVPADLNVVVIQLSRRNVTVAQRERLATCNHDWPSWIARHLPHISEWVILRTCHRFELYLVSPSPREEAARAVAQLSGMIADLDVDGADAYAHCFTILYGSDAAAHLCRVAAGLDSAVLGEAQILGQVIRCYEDGIACGALGPWLASFFRAAIRAGKRARTETMIGARAANMSSVALARAAAWIGATDDANVNNVNVVVIGAGEMARLALKALAARKAQRVTVVNRSLDNARAVLLDPAWRACTLDSLDAALCDADLVFSATRAEGFMVTAVQVKAKLERAGVAKRLALVDLALPRDIDPAVRDLANVLLIDLDDLHESLDETRRERAQAIPQVEAIIDQELHALEAELRESAVHPVVADLRRKAEEIRVQEVERALLNLETLDERVKEQIRRLSRSLVNKLLHSPTVGIKTLVHSHDAGYLTDTVRTLFALDSGDVASHTCRRDRPAAPES
jgi:glutamyl-tRNA reductase